MKRQHPIIALKYAAKNIWLLVFPLVRGIIALRFSVEQVFIWLKGAWFDIIIIAIIIGIGVWRWYYTLFSTSEDCFYRHAGKFFKTRSAIPFSSISTISCVKSPIYRIIKGAKVSIDTNSVEIKGSDVDIIMRSGDADALFSVIPSSKIQSEGYTYNPSFGNLLFFSLAFSSTLSGAIYAATFFFETGRIIDASILTKQINNASAVLPIKISPYAYALAMLIITSWMISFIMNLIKYSAFTLYKENDKIRIESGVITKRNYHINPAKINYADLRQNLITKIFRVMSISVNCTGYGKPKNEIPVFVPMTTKNRAISAMKTMFPNLNISANCLRPRKSSFIRYVAFPITIGSIFAYIAYSAKSLNLNLSQLIFFAALMAIFPCVLMLLTRITAYLCDGCGFNGKAITIRCYSARSLHTIVISKENIAKVIVKQNLFQKIVKSCDITFFARSERTQSYKVKSVILKDVNKFLLESGIYSHYDKNSCCTVYNE